MQYFKLTHLTQTLIKKVKTQKHIQLLSSHTNTLANHLLVLISFFLSISTATVGLLYTFIFILFLFKPLKLLSFNDIKNNYVLWAILLYVGIYYFGIFIADDTTNAYKYAKTATFLLNAILILIFLEPRFIPRILSAYILGVFISEIFSYSLAFNLIDGPFFGSHPLASYQNPSPFMYHIHYGFTLAFTSFILLLLFKNSSMRLNKILIGLFFISISTNLLLNIGRTGYILYIIGIFLFIFFNYKQQIIKSSILALTSISLIFILAYEFSPHFQERIDLTAHSMTKIFNDSNYSSSIGIRLEKYRQAYGLFIKEPFFGYGTGEHLKVIYNDAKEKKLWYSSVIRHHPNLDSEYLDILIQFGLLGFIIYINIFYQALIYKQPDIKLKQIQLVLVIYYILFSFEAVGVIHHTLAQTFLFFITITLVQKLPKEPELSKISFKEFSIYSFVALLFFLRSQIHFGAPIKSYIHQFLV